MKKPCPKCRESGGDSSGDNMTVYEDGHGWCFVCESRFSKSEVGGGPAPVRVKSTLSLSHVESYPFAQDPERNLPNTYATLFGVRGSFSEETGKLEKLFYPYFEGKDITGYKMRTFPKSGFPWIGKAGKSLYGKQLCKGKGFLFITEGEEDYHAVHAMLAEKPAQSHDVISLPNGASLDKTVMAESEFFSSYKRIYLALDSDEPGVKATEKIADWLAPMAEVRIVDNGTLKDPSGWLQMGITKGREWRSMAAKSPIYEPEGIVNGIDILLDELLMPLEEGYKLPFDGLQDKLHGVRKAEITTVCAGSGIGKTTLVREITRSLIEQGLSTANVALEDQMNVTAQALIALDMDVPLHTFRFHPPSKELVQPHYDKMVANGNTYFYKHFAGINSQALMNKLYYYARSKACDFIILDHLSMVIASTASNNERKDIDTLMTNLAKMVVETGVGLIQIVHLKRTGGDKSYAKGGEVELTDLRGSAALEQLSWNVVGLERDQQGDDRDFSRIRVLKNRTFGFTGLADTVKYDSATGRMKSVVIESDIPDLSMEDI
jgi:twinkle protein